MGSERISDMAGATRQVGGRATLQASGSPLSAVPERWPQTTAVRPKPLCVTVSPLSPMPPPKQRNHTRLQPVPPGAAGGRGGGGEGQSSHLQGVPPAQTTGVQVAGG